LFGSVRGKDRNALSSLTLKQDGTILSSAPAEQLKRFGKSKNINSALDAVSKKDLHSDGNLRSPVIYSQNSKPSQCNNGKTAEEAKISRVICSKKTELPEMNTFLNVKDSRNIEIKPSTSTVTDSLPKDDVGSAIPKLRIGIFRSSSYKIMKNLRNKGLEPKATFYSSSLRSIFSKDENRLENRKALIRNSSEKWIDNNKQASVVNKIVLSRITSYKESSSMKPRLAKNA